MFKIPQVTEPGFKSHQLIIRPGTTKNHSFGKTQQHVTECTKLYSFNTHVISKVLRRQS